MKRLGERYYEDTIDDSVNYHGGGVFDEKMNRYVNNNAVKPLAGLSLSLEDQQSFANRINNSSKPTLIDDLQANEQKGAPLSASERQDIARGALQGGKSGISGMLMGGGMSAVLAGAGPAGWAALAGGALLSELESQNEAEALQEQANIEAETNRRANVQKAGNSLLSMFNSIGNMKA